RRATAPTLVRLLLLGVVFFAMAGAGLIVMADAALGWTGFESADVVVFLLTFPALPVVGAFLATRRPANPIGWLFLTAALGLALSAFAHGYGDYAIDARPGALPGADLVTSLGWTGWVAFALLAVYVPLLFPTGRLPSGRWRPVAIVGGVAVAAETLALALRPGSLEDFHAETNPLGSSALAGLLDGLEVLARPGVLIVLMAGVVSLWVRYRQGNATLRAQVKWMGYATGVLVAVDVIGNLMLGGGLDDHPAICTWGTTATKPVYGTVVPALLYTGLPVAVAVAVLRHRLFDVDRLIRRSAVYAALWAAIAVLYYGVALALGVAVTGRGPVAVGVLVTIAFSVVFQPVRHSIERLADRWVFGRRPSGYELASGFGSTSETMDGLDEMAASLAEIVRRGLSLAWARVTLEPSGGGASAVAEAPVGGVRADRPQLTVPVTRGGVTLGQIECGPALDSRRQSERRALLDLLAHEAGLALHNFVLARALTEHVQTVDAQAAELAASRARIVLAQDAERRRVERDIHDGAQQELVAMIAKLRVARELVGRDPESAVATLEGLQGDAQTALRGIRELAQGIHPSVLADQGLVAAVEDRSARLPLQVVVVANKATRGHRFPDAVEVAAFFVVSEALANVLKHSGAARATVTFSRLGLNLVVEVSDDGNGFVASQAQGNGLTYLADRVGAVGGNLQVRSEPGAGTTVAAVLPIPDQS
ncbi:MAG TPA: sensor histidine kinase, partial [Acidimicrobiia bacterium]|nr:sensor histidine kinase [Acidimicrobiia bacterium]